MLLEIIYSNSSTADAPAAYLARFRLARAECRPTLSLISSYPRLALRVISAGISSRRFTGPVLAWSWPVTLANCRRLPEVGELIASAAGADAKGIASAPDEVLRRVMVTIRVPRPARQQASVELRKRKRGEARSAMGPGPEDEGPRSLRRVLYSEPRGSAQSVQ